MGQNGLDWLTVSTGYPASGDVPGFEAGRLLHGPSLLGAESQQQNTSPRLSRGTALHRCPAIPSMEQHKHLPTDTRNLLPRSCLGL